MKSGSRCRSKFQLNSAISWRARPGNLRSERAAPGSALFENAGLQPALTAVVSAVSILTALPLTAIAVDSPEPMSLSMPRPAPDYSMQEQPVNANASQFSGDISSLERKFFARDFSDEPINTRLERLERIVYGKSRAGSVPERVSRLLLDLPSLQSAANTETSSPPEQAQPAIVYDPVFSMPGSAPSLNDELSNMEKEVFGRTYSTDSMLERISRLEHTVFAGESDRKFSPIVSRVNRLEAALQPRFSYNQAAAANQQSAPIYQAFKNSCHGKQEVQSSSNCKSEKPHPFIHKLGKFLAGVGTIAGETIGGVAAGSMMGYGYGFGGYGFAYPGFGYPGYYGYGGPRFMGYYW